MTVYVRTISGKTISMKCDKRQSITRIKDEIATLEVTLRLQGGMEEDETMNPVGSTGERIMRRKHSEIGDTQISDDPEYIKREIGIASRRSEEIMENLLQKFQTNSMGKMQLLTTNTTIEKKVENDDN